MKRKYLIILNIFYLVGILFIFVLGPYYSNFSLENVENVNPNPVVKSYSNLNFSSQQNYELLAPTFLDWYSIVVVNFTSTQPVYVLITENSLLSLYEKSTFGVESGTLIYHIIEPSYYTASIEGINGTAGATVAVYTSTVIRNKPYELWGQIMYYGGIGLLIFSIAVLAISWLRKGSAPLKHPLRTAVAKKAEKKR